MFFSPRLIEALELVLRRSCNISDPVFPDGRVAGGINECIRLRAGKHLFFVKINSSVHYPHMFALEAQGLKLIASTNTIAVPEVLGHGVADHEQFLLLNWVERGPGNDCSQEKLGSGLARMHRITATEFGLAYDNYIGSLKQINSPKKTWENFFAQNRIEPMLKLAVENGLVDNRLFADFEKVLRKLEQLFPAEPPALVHGDLWSGNYMVNGNEEPMLIDPAVYYGHREIDLAMTRLFGGFAHAFYDAYQEEYPLEKGWEDRLDLWNLYPLLVHLNLFGTGYLPQIKAILQKYC